MTSAKKMAGRGAVVLLSSRTAMKHDFEDSSTRSWETIADDWIAHADSNDYRNHLLFPTTFRLLGDVSGRRVLDLGCGEGGYARELARRGAAVVGVDGSDRLLDEARRRSEGQGMEITWVLANASALTGIADASFDLVLASMSLMDVEDYPAAVAEAFRVLVPGGELVMSITHPCFSAPVSEWVRDAEGRPAHFAVDRYFDRAVWEDRVAKSFRTPVLRRHRPLEDYVGAPLSAGFVLRQLVEPTVTEEERKLSPRFEYLTRVPYFLFLRWGKA